MHLSVYIATSLDGFIAREDGAIDWLEASNDPNEDYGYKTFMDTVDVLVMGRHTYEKVLSFPEWYYGEKPVAVLSSEPVFIPDRIQKTCFNLVSKSLEEVLAALTERGYERAYIDGGRTICQFLNAGLINRMILTRIPILLGGGIALFSDLRNELPLQHVRTLAYANGLVQSEYNLQPMSEA